jgi:hypothetical protein
MLQIEGVQVDYINVQGLDLPFYSYQSGTGTISSSAGTYTIMVYLTGSPTGQYYLTLTDSNYGNECIDIDSAGYHFFYSKPVSAPNGIYITLGMGSCF